MNKQTILKNTIINQIIPQNKIYLKNNIIISIKDNHLNINTKNNEYTLKIKKKKNIFLWTLYRRNTLIYSFDIKIRFKEIINFILNIESK